jgi:hypothetical protein
LSRSLWRTAKKAPFFGKTSGCMQRQCIHCMSRRSQALPRLKLPLILAPQSPKQSRQSAN